MMAANLLEFLKSGVLGTLGLGIGLSQVRQDLGEPEEVSLSDDPIIWKYGDLQVSFHNQIVVSVAVRFFKDESPLSSVFTLSNPIFTGNTTFEEFKEVLTREGVSFKWDDQTTFPDSIPLVSEAGVSVVFDLNKGQSRLEAFHLMDQKYAPARAARRIKELSRLVDHLERKLPPEQPETTPGS